MTDTAAAQLRRILHLIPSLADGEEHSIEEVARLAGVDRRTLLRDLRSLAERAETPAAFVEGVSIYIEGDRVSVHASHFLRPMRLTRSELCALELGLAVLRGERPPEEHRAIDRARERLRRVIVKLPDDGPGEQGRYAHPGDEIDAALFSRVRAALRERAKLRIGYHKADERGAEERVVCPYTLALASGRWYLVAHCERSEGLRFFRMDRIVSAERLEARFRVPDDFSLERVAAEGKALAAPGASRLVVRYSARIARWIAEREGKDPAPDGSLTLAHPLADLGWAVRHVLQYGPDAEILEPAEAREAIRERLARMAALAPSPAPQAP